MIYMIYIDMNSDLSDLTHMFDLKVLNKGRARIRCYVRYAGFAFSISTSMNQVYASKYTLFLEHEVA